MGVTHSPAKLFRSKFNKGQLKSLFEQYLAVKTVVGSDGTSLPKFVANLDAELDIILRKVSVGSYSFTRYREKLLLKGKNKTPRVISIPTIRDRLLLKFLSEVLIEIYPQHKTMLPHGMVKTIHQLSKAASKDHVFLRLDVKEYYPSVDHEILMRIVRRKIRKKELIELIEGAIKTATGSSTAADEIKTGLPQGLSISNVLASLYFEDIDKIMQARKDLHYFRYVDDVLIIGAPEVAEAAASELPSLIKRMRKLECHHLDSEGKSSMVKVSDGIDYLGYRFSDTDLSVRPSSYRKMFSSLVKLFTSMKYRQNSQAAIWRLNLRISGCIYKGKRVGWMFYFSQSENMRQLKRLDRFVRINGAKFLNLADRAALKTFTKAYHEIRFNSANSKYFPNFDEFDYEQMTAALKSLLPRRRWSELDGLEGEALEEFFSRTIRREISELEKDMLDAIS